MNQALKDLLARAIELEGKAELFDEVEPAVFDADDGLGPEVKAWAACASCGSRNVDEYADGTAACEDCGMPLSEAKDFDDFDDGVDLDLDVKTIDEADEWLNEPEPVSVLSEFELLRAQRASSGI